MMKRVLLVNSLVVLAVLIMSGFMTCNPPKPEGIVSYMKLDATCDDYEDLVKRAIEVAYEGREDIPEKYRQHVIDIITGVKLTTTVLFCEKLDGYFGYSQSHGKNGGPAITLSTEKTLSHQWYHDLVSMFDDEDDTVVFAAGILIHEATHITDFMIFGTDSPEYNPTMNQYEFWGFGDYVSDIIACYDNMRRGAGQDEEHMMESVLGAIFPFVDFDGNQCEKFEE